MGKYFRRGKENKGVYKIIMEKFVLKGDICYSKSQTELGTVKNGYLVCIEGKSGGIYEKLPEEYRELPLEDYSGKLIFPGMIDLHIHAPQFAFRGTGMDLELMPWLDRQTFPEETRYQDREYAKKAYAIFAEQMRKSATARVCMFATLHPQATEILMEEMEKTGLISYVGKVNMDRESIPELQEKDYRESARATREWLETVQGKFERTYPILTPRFVPSCSDELMEELQKIQEVYGIPVQSHLSENLGEIEFVKELCPQSRFYGEVYDKFGLFGGNARTIMAHCVYSGEAETDLMKENGVFIAHCPASNLNLSSGIAPIRRYLEKGLKIGLGSDVAGGHTESMFRAVTDAIQISKMYWRLVDDTCRPLTFAEAFYLATKGGGAFFGNVGSFDSGCEFDAVVLDDSIMPMVREMPVEDRMERAAYLSLDLLGICAKYVRGVKIYE